MTYMLLVLEDPKQRTGRSAEEGREVYERMLRFTDDLTARGVRKASESLRSQADAVRVQVRGGKPVVRDGPFTECKEMVGGFFLLDCKTHEEAIAIARTCPAAEWATLEVREVGACYD